MTRLDRKHWSADKFGIKPSGGILDAFDNSIKSVFRITDQEYDRICLIGTEEQLDVLLQENPTFGQKRHLLQLLESLITTEQ